MSDEPDILKRPERVTRQYAQSVILTLEDGRKVSYSGPAQIDPADLGVKVAKIEFTPPMPLPAGCYFENQGTKADGR